MQSVLRLIGLVVASILLIACSASEYQAIPAGATVLVLGDSVSYGTGASRGEDYPTLLAAKTGWNIVNAGVPGDTSAGGLQRLPELLQEHAPRLLLIELGGNDFLRHVPVEETAANLKAIVMQSREKEIPVVLLAMPRPNLFSAAFRTLSDESMYENVANETQTPLVSGIFSEVLSRNELKSDPIHPNAEGYRQVAEQLFVALRELGFAR